MNKQPVRPLEISWFCFLFISAVAIGTEIVALLLILFCPAMSDTVLSTVACYGTMLLVIALYMLLHKRSFRDIGFRRIGASDMLMGVFMGILAQPAAMLIAYLSSFLFTDIVSESIDSMLSETPLWLMIIFSAVIPAFFEETATRGIILFGYRKSLPTWALILFPSLIFGVMHGNATQFLYATALGCLFAGMALYSDSVFPSMIAHFTLNASQMLLAAWSSGVEIPEEAAEAAAVFDIEVLGTYLLFTAATVVPIVLCMKRLKKNREIRKRLYPQFVEAEPAVNVSENYGDVSVNENYSGVSLDWGDAPYGAAPVKAPASGKFPPAREMVPFYLALVLGAATMVLFEIAMKMA